MSQPSEDALARVRARFSAADATRRTAVVELAALVARSGNAPPDAVTAERIHELEARLPTLEHEWTEAHTALGRAMLAEFERDLNQLAYPPHDPEAARELRLMADNLRRACLAVLSDWPELAEEAKRRLRPPASSDPGALHG